MGRVKNLYMEITEDDMSGDIKLKVDLSRSRSMTKKEIAFKKKFEYRMKMVAKFLGHDLTVLEFNHIHRTLTKEMNESSGK